jgi:hypothetical protein
MEEGRRIDGHQGVDGAHEQRLHEMMMISAWEGGSQRSRSRMCQSRALHRPVSVLSGASVFRIFQNRLSKMADTKPKMKNEKKPLNRQNSSWYNLSFLDYG